MATLQRYIHYKLHNKSMMLRSVKEGRKRGTESGFYKCVFFDTDKCGVIFTLW